jgi:hypothetical protein
VGVVYAHGTSSCHACHDAWREAQSCAAIDQALAQEQAFGR